MTRGAPESVLLLPPPAPGAPTPSAPPHGLELLTGEGLFVGDVHRPGMLAAVVVRSHEAHGRIVGVDTDEARRMPGVHAVLTGADLVSPVTIPIRSFERPGMAAAAQPVLAGDRVRYVGEPVAVVVAENGYLAEDAAELVAVEIDPLVPVLGPGDESDVPLFERLEGNVLCRYETAHGDLERCLERAAIVVEEEFVAGRHTGLPLETRGLVAEWSPDRRRLDLWGATKFLSFNRDVLASWFGIDEEAVDCRRVSVGGMLGVRGEVYPEDFLIPWAARVTGRPVRWVEDRREHFVAVNHAPGLRYRIRVALAADGGLLALAADVDLDMGAYARGNGGRLALLAIEELPGPYVWEATAITATGWATSKTPVGSVRAPVALESTFARERTIDLAAARLRVDPAQVRRRSLVPASAMPFTRRFGGDGHDLVLADGDYPAFFEKLLDVSGFAALRARCERRRARGELAGVGLGLFVAHSGLGHEEQVAVAVRDGRIVVSTAASEVGQGLDRAVRLVASEALGIPGASIDVVSGQVGGMTRTAGTYSSRLTIFVGNAVLDGCTRFVAAARDAVGAWTGVAPDDVVVAGDGLRADGTLVAWGDLDGLAVAGTHRNAHPTYGFGGTVAVVRVDPGTGVVTVEELALACDCGRPLDPPSVLGQLRGGAVHGLGATLLEELEHDENGQAVSLTLADYLVPLPTDVPRALRVELLEGWATTNALGVKGAGEAGVVGVGAAVANAVADALGSPAGRARRLPLDPAGLRAEPSADSARGQTGGSGGEPRPDGATTHEGGKR